ncbi:hypothetical protein TYRP_001125 [Tyrophagus putrescentiae]|nr:hypothetical protein TYRP_001125 [Tyrophagus putrescentiae]
MAANKEVVTNLRELSPALYIPPAMLYSMRLPTTCEASTQASRMAPNHQLKGQPPKFCCEKTSTLASDNSHGVRCACTSSPASHHHHRIARLDEASTTAKVERKVDSHVNVRRPVRLRPVGVPNGQNASVQVRLSGGLGVAGDGDDRTARSEAGGDVRRLASGRQDDDRSGGALQRGVHRGDAGGSGWVHRDCRLCGQLDEQILRGGTKNHSNHTYPRVNGRLCLQTDGAHHLHGLDWVLA